MPHQAGRAAIAFEFAAIGYLVRRLKGRDLRTLTLSILVVVGLHFVIMGLAHGPLMAALGVAATIVALIGLWVPKIPLRAVGAADGVLKIGFGVWMLAWYPAVTYL